MNKLSKKVLAVLIATGLLVVGTAAFAMPINSQGYGYGMMRGGFQGNAVNTSSTNDGYYCNNFTANGNTPGAFNRGFGHMGGMMGGNGWAGNQVFDASELMSIEVLKENVEEYLTNFDGDFEIEDIFTYTNSDYYFSIIESDTGRGAMELLVNPVTGYVYPEHGPNMMWNTKFGMQSYSGFRGMMGAFNLSNSYDEADAITAEEALEKANDYLGNINSDLIAEDDGHAFYGYFTFHVMDSDEPSGMMSVNAYTGDVWYHNWHGDLIEVISGEHE